jgi:hypothetical protein
LKGSCLALLVSHIWRNRKAGTVDWLVLVSLGVMLLAAAAFGWVWFLWWVTEGGCGYELFLLPGGFALIAYVVLAVRLGQRVSGPTIYGMPVVALLAGLGLEFYLLWLLTPTELVPLLLSFGLGILAAAGCLAGMNRLHLAGPPHGRRVALVLFLVVFLVALVGGIAFSRPGTRLRIVLQHPLGVRGARYADLRGADLSGVELGGADLTGVERQGASVGRHPCDSGQPSGGLTSTFSGSTIVVQ